MITHHGRPAAYLVDVEPYEALNERLAVMEVIARGEKDIREERTLTHAQAKKSDGQMVEIVWSEPSLSGLERIADYIVLDKPDAAVRLVKRVFQCVDLLEQTPLLGPRIPELPGVALYRQMVAGPAGFSAVTMVFR